MKRRSEIGFLSVEVAHGPHEAPIMVEVEVTDDPGDHITGPCSTWDVKRAHAVHPRTGRELRVDAGRLDHDRIDRAVWEAWEDRTC